MAEVSQQIGVDKKKSPLMKAAKNSQLKDSHKFFCVNL